MDHDVLTAHHAARLAPEDGATRVAYARQLLRIGRNGAAAHELAAATALGAPVPPELSTLTVSIGGRTVALELPERPVGVARHDRSDVLFEGARVRLSARAVPLALALLDPCETCLSFAEVYCPECGGSKSVVDAFSERGCYRCSPRGRVSCNVCSSTAAPKPGRSPAASACRHQFVEEHRTSSSAKILRCTTCGLAAIEPARADAGERVLACERCGFIARDAECACPDGGIRLSAA